MRYDDDNRLFDDPSAAGRPSPIPGAAGSCDEGTPARREQIEIALEIERLIARCEASSLPFVAYLLRVARAALAEGLGERARR